MKCPIVEEIGGPDRACLRAGKCGWSGATANGFYPRWTACGRVTCYFTHFFISSPHTPFMHTPQGATQVLSERRPCCEHMFNYAQNMNSIDAASTESMCTVRRCYIICVIEHYGVHPISNCFNYTMHFMFSPKVFRSTITSR